mgnify:CR=1 FL=1|jgi:hypothetical protein
MKLNKKKVIYLLDNQNEVMSQKMISELKIKEEYINNQSKTKYQNSEPCIIIRTKICNTVYMDFNDFINNCINENKKMIHVKDLPDNLLNSIEFDQNIEILIIK